MAVKEAKGNKSMMSPLWPCITPTFTLRLTIIKGIPIRRRSRQLRAFMRILPTRKDPFHQETNTSSTLL